MNGDYMGDIAKAKKDNSNRNNNNSIACLVKNINTHGHMHKVTNSQAHTRIKSFLKMIRTNTCGGCVSDGSHCAH